NVPIAGPSNVVRMDAVGRHVANRGRTHQKSIFIEMPAGVILVVVIAELGCVALKQKVLPIEVGDAHLLVAAAKSVQAAVGIFLEKKEVSRIVLQAVGVQVPENAHARLLLREQQPAKIAAELLDAGANGY